MVRVVLNTKEKDMKFGRVDIKQLDRAIEGDVRALEEAFYWGDTVQGHEYWGRQAMGRMPLDIEGLKKIRDAYLLREGVAPEEHPAEMAARLSIVITVKVGGISYTYDGRKTDVG